MLNFYFLETLYYTFDTHPISFLSKRNNEHIPDKGGVSLALLAATFQNVTFTEIDSSKDKFLEYHGHSLYNLWDQSRYLLNDIYVKQNWYCFCDSLHSLEASFLCSLKFALYQPLIPPKTWQNTEDCMCMFLTNSIEMLERLVRREVKWPYFRTHYANLFLKPHGINTNDAEYSTN